MTDSGQVPKSGQNEDPTIVIFLGLYLLLLAFFILLNTISSFDAERSQEASESVGVAFSEIIPPVLRTNEERVSKGAVIELDSYQGQVQAALATIIKLVETTSMGEGQLMVRSSVEQLFEEDRETLSADAMVFMDRLARVLLRDEPGIRRELDIVLGVGDVLPEKVDAGSSQHLRQVAQFIHQLVEREVPVDQISFALSAGNDGGILMFFNPRPVEDQNKSDQWE